ncbi:MAG: NAD-dependent epimerase/dehydratase family protein, partial [Acidimicrobiales bacterium]|nr:NAD-dependent epimerase/dehydratase family protein [Acidimicrobiales bacterium]
VAADYLGLQAWLGRGLPVLRVRAFNHLGPGQTDKFVAPALASRIARAELEGSPADGGEVVLPVGDLSARRDFTDVRDVVRAYRLLMRDGEPGEVYNVCSGVDLAVQDLADQ